MEKIPLLKWLLQGIPECTVMLFLSCKLLNYKFNEKNERVRLFFGGFLLAVCAYLIRFLPITQGVHSVVLLAILSFFTINCTKSKPQYGIISSTITVIFLVIYEGTCLETISSFFQLNIVNLPKNSISFILLGMPHIIFLFITGLVVNKLYDIKQKAKVAKNI